MFEPKYLICLESKVFFSEEIVCLGSQLKSIVENIGELIENHVWFCADVDAFSPIPKNLGYDTFRIKKIGTSASLIKLCNNIHQFLSGVFIAVRKRNENLANRDLSIDTEDEQFRPLELEGILIEIRAFDTSYFELYSEDLELMKELSKIYRVEIEYAKA